MNGKIYKRRTIGLFLDWAGTYYQMNVWAGAADQLRKTDTNLICFVGGAINPPHLYEQQRNKLYDLVHKKNIDGLIILSSSIAHYVGHDEMHAFFARFSSFPCVSIGMRMRGIPSIMVDNEAGMKALVNHLIHAHGHRRFVFINGPEGSMDAQQRYSAFINALSENNLSPDESIFLSGDFSVSSGQGAIRTLLDRQKIDFHAVVAANDAMALGAITVLRDHGSRIPQDISVVGFDDIEFDKLLIPPMTTVRQP